MYDLVMIFLLVLFVMNGIPGNYNSYLMLFGKLLESVNDNEENDLMEM